MIYTLMISIIFRSTHACRESKAHEGDEGELDCGKHLSARLLKRAGALLYGRHSGLSYEPGMGLQVLDREVSDASGG